MIPKFPPHGDDKGRHLSVELLVPVNIRSNVIDSMRVVAMRESSEFRAGESISQDVESGLQQEAFG